MESTFVRHWIAVAVSLCAIAAVMSTPLPVPVIEVDSTFKRYSTPLFRLLPFSPSLAKHRPLPTPSGCPPSPSQVCPPSQSSVSLLSRTMSSMSSASSSASSYGHQKKQPTDTYHGNGNHVFLNRNPEKKQNSPKPTRPTAVAVAAAAAMRNNSDKRTGEKSPQSSQQALPKPTDNPVRPLHNETASTVKPKIETTTHDRAIIVAPNFTCPTGQQMGPNRVCRPTFNQDD